MSNIKLSLVVDKSDAYLNFQRERLLSLWEVDQKETQNVTSLDEVGGSTLFGGAPCSIIKLEDVDAVKKLVDAISNKSQSDFEDVLENGLIILTSVARNSTKKLEASVQKIGGEVIIPPGKKDNPVPVKLLSTLNLKSEVKKFILDYVGEDYESILPLVLSISEMPKKHQALITEQDIYIRFPQSRGSVPPWEIEKPLMAGNIQKTIEISRRIEVHKTSLLVLSVIKNKLQLAYRIASIRSMKPNMNDADIAAILEKENNYQFTLASRTAKQLGLNTLTKGVTIIARTEDKIKGGSAAPSSATFEAALIELCILFKGKNE